MIRGVFVRNICLITPSIKENAHGSLRHMSRFEINLLDDVKLSSVTIQMEKASVSYWHLNIDASAQKAKTRERRNTVLVQ